EPVEVVAVRHRALRVRRRRHVDRHGAAEERFVEGIEIGQEAARPGRRQVDRLALGGRGARPRGGLETVWGQGGRGAGGGPPGGAWPPRRRETGPPASR